MIDTMTPSKLKDPGIDYDTDHLAETIRSVFGLYSQRVFMQQPEQKSYVCECKHCDLTLYTSTKRVNCQYCGSSDPDVFECRELK